MYISPSRVRPGKREALKFTWHLGKHIRLGSGNSKYGGGFSFFQVSIVLSLGRFVRTFHYSETFFVMIIVNGMHVSLFKPRGLALVHLIVALMYFKLPFLIQKYFIVSKFLCFFSLPVTQSHYPQKPIYLNFL